MKVTVEKPEIITLLYQQERSDPDYGSCLWARFYLDTKNYTMSIESDCGNYSHGWYPTPDSETFLHLLCRMNNDYLLGKLAERTMPNPLSQFDVIRCAQCACAEKHKTASFGYVCRNEESPCYCRTAYADFGCLYGKRKTDK